MTETNFTMTINGAAVAGAERFGIENPATAAVFAEAPNCTQDELNAAVSAAKAALPAWRKTSIDERRAVMQAIA
ncbi:MAG: aldehyde dehydrogenase family protein, partial [Pseudomonadota bacterium]